MAIINEQQAAPEIASIPVNNVALAPNGGTADTAMANFKGSDAAMPALASIANIAATMAPAIPVGSEPTADDRDVNALTLDSGSGSQSPTSPRKPRRTLRKATSTATSTEKAKAKEKDDSADDKKWVKATVLNLKDRVDDIETIHLSLAEAVRIDHEENQTEFRAVYRTLQESQSRRQTWNNNVSVSRSYYRGYRRNANSELISGSTFVYAYWHGFLESYMPGA
ncbi:hypothetical protein PQX77_009761 [Marasmius sp. AFHP31]|nr:hypothetical protein PQX77_009761 [Marasmius sp. AFHP31]